MASGADGGASLQPMVTDGVASLQPTLAEGVEEYAFRAKAMLEAEDYAGAAREGSRALDILPDLAEVAVVRGRALLCPLLDRVAEGTEPICQKDFKEAYEAFRLALIMDPSNTEAAKELERLGELLKHYVPDTADAGPNAGPGPDAGAVTSPDAGPDAVPDAGPHAGLEIVEELDPESDVLDVIVVGAGAAGIGCAFMLTHVFGLDPSRVLNLERGEAIGTSFRTWPEEMRFISPSFNQQGWTNSFDLNSIAYGTSPAYTLHAQHPSGAQYADYLTELAEAAGLRVKLRTDVIRTEQVDGVFHVHVRAGSAPGGGQAGGGQAGGQGEQGEQTTMRARYVVWAAGEFQYPRESSATMAGTELCVHNSRVRSWASLPGDDFVLIGGYESGADAAINLAKAGKRSTVLASNASWNIQTADPSTELAPFTADRLRQVTAAGFSPRPQLLAPLRVLRVEKAAAGGFNVTAVWKAAEQLPQMPHSFRKPIVEVGEVDGTAETGTRAGAEGSELLLHTAYPPVLCTGFEGSVAAAARHLFNLADESDKAKGCLAGAPMLTEEDESTKVPGVFLVGPSVRHGELSFCFVYKFRQRFGIVANAICRGLGRDTKAAVETARKMNMYLDDFSCCKGACGDAC